MLEQNIPSKSPQKLHVAIIGTVGVPACYGCFESLVDNLLDFTPPNVEYTVFCSGKKYEKRLESYKGAKLVYLEMDVNGKDSIFYDFKSMKISDIVIGDNKGIIDYIKSEYSKTVKNKRVELIAYGGDQVSRVQDDSLFEKYPFCREPYSVTVCRIEPENNVHVILEAFSEMLDETLVFVGNWEKSEYGRSLKEKFSVCKNIHLLAPIYEPHIVNWLRSNAHVYIHGHSAGGKTPSLVEAMNLSIPILAFDCVYNRATTEEKCLYWKIAEDLQNLMKNKSGKFAEIAREMGEAGKRLYSWERIARQYNALYQ